MGTSIGRHDSFVERHAWKVFVGMTGIVALFGVGDMLAGGSTYAEGEADIVFAVAGTGLFGLLIGVCGWTVAEWKTWTLGTLRGQVLGLDGPSVPASQET